MGLAQLCDEEVLHGAPAETEEAAARWEAKVAEYLPLVRCVALQFVGGGASYSGGGATELGCDLERDLRIMKQVNATQDDAIERVCMKPEIAKAMKVCRDKAAQTTAATSSDPYIAARLAK